MNSYIEAQIMSMVTFTRNFEQSCEAAARKNDGVIDKDEEQVLKKIRAATEKFRKELGKIK